MIGFAGPVEIKQLPVLLKQSRFARRRGQRAGLLRRRHRIVISSRLGIGGRQRADERRHAMMRQFTGLFGIFDGLNPVPKVCVRTSRQQPGQIIQNSRGVGLDLQRLLVLGNRCVHAALLEQGIPQVVVDFGVVGHDLQRLLVLGDRFVHPIFFEQRVG